MPLRLTEPRKPSGLGEAQRLRSPHHRPVTFTQSRVARQIPSKTLPCRINAASLVVSERRIYAAAMNFVAHSGQMHPNFLVYCGLDGFERARLDTYSLPPR